MVSLIDHLPRSTSTTAGWLKVCGEASSKPANSELADGFGEAFAAAFLASARFSAICSRMLSCGTGGGASSSEGSGCGLRAGDLVGDFGALRVFRLGCARSVCVRGLGVGATDWVRMRGFARGVGVARTVGEGEEGLLKGEFARDREDG